MKDTSDPYCWKRNLDEDSAAYIKGLEALMDGFVRTKFSVLQMHTDSAHLKGGGNHIFQIYVQSWIQDQLPSSWEVLFIDFVAFNNLYLSKEEPCRTIELFKMFMFTLFRA